MGKYSETAQKAWKFIEELTAYLERHGVQILTNERLYITGEPGVDVARSNTPVSFEVRVHPGSPRQNDLAQQIFDETLVLLPRVVRVGEPYQTPGGFLAVEVWPLD